MNNCFILYLVLILSSCMSDSPRLQIKNNTEFPLTEVKYGVSSGRLFAIDTIHVNESYASILVFDDSIVGDGAYVLQYHLNDKECNHSFGYYTNGTSLNRGIVVSVELDTMIFKLY